MNHQKVIGSKLLLFAHLTGSSRPGLRPFTQLLLTFLPFQESSQDCLCWEGASCIHPCFLGRCPFLRVVNVWPWVSLCLCKRVKCCRCRRHHPSTCIRNQSTSCVFAVFTLIVAISRHSPFFQAGCDGRGWQPPPRPLMALSRSQKVGADSTFFNSSEELWSAQTLACSFTCLCKKPGEGLSETFQRPGSSHGASVTSLSRVLSILH